MTLVKGSDRILAGEDATPSSGTVSWRPIKSLWIGLMTLTGVIGAPLAFSWSALAVFLILTGITLCSGHSVGMHRRLIHNSFECPRWLEYLLVYLGVLVGMAGPIGMMRQHDLRDWAQRQTTCHDYLCHARGFWRDYWWQCHCVVDLSIPPKFELEPRIAHDRIYQWMERTWMWQQLPLALLLYWLGGWSFIVWGIALRVAVSVTGHWLVGHFAHHEYGPRNSRMSWRILGASVQGRDVPLAGFISMGESWHNNHHAYPGSARIGLEFGQPDPGWWFICLLERMGLVWNIVTPATMPARPERIRTGNDTGWSICKLRCRIWQTLFGTA